MRPRSLLHLAESLRHAKISRCSSSAPVSLERALELDRGGERGLRLALEHELDVLRARRRAQRPRARLGPARAELVLAGHERAEPEDAVAARERVHADATARAVDLLAEDPLARVRDAAADVEPEPAAQHDVARA